MTKVFILPKGKEALRAELNSLPSNVPHKVTIEPYKRTRTVDQNSRYWAILNDISDQVQVEGKNYATEVWHEYFRTKFLGKDTFLVDGSPVLVTKSSRKLNVMEFGDYMTQVEVWAVEHEVRFFESLAEQT
jgi:hypothetical protein